MTVLGSSFVGYFAHYAVARTAYDYLFEGGGRITLAALLLVAGIILGLGLMRTLLGAARGEGWRGDERRAYQRQRGRERAQSRRAGKRAGGRRRGRVAPPATPPDQSDRRDAS